MKASGAALARRFCTPALGYLLSHWTALLHKSFCTRGLDEPAGLRRAARLGAPVASIVSRLSSVETLTISLVASLSLSGRPFHFTVW